MAPRLRDIASPAPAALLLVLSHVVISISLYIKDAGGSFATAFSPATLFAPWHWSSSVDILLASVTSATVLLVVAAASFCAPLACYRSFRSRPLGWAFATAFSLCATWAIVKVVAAPASGVCFWSGSVILFFAATLEGFAAERILGAVPSWARTVAATQLRIPLTEVEGAAAAEEDGGAGGGADASAVDAAPLMTAAKKGGGAASLWRLVSLSRPDAGYLAGGFAALVVAAIASTLTPGYVGRGIDALSGDPAVFQHILYELLAVSLVSGVFTGLRGWSFTVAISRLKVRLRDKLFRAILAQELAFFDATSTGELTSRMASDTTAVGDSVALNANVFLRSLIMAIGSLIFMFSLSWRLTLLAFTIIPPTIIVSRIYGKFVRVLSKRSQSRLAECNRIVEETIASISTVRSFGDEQSAADRHAFIVSDFYHLNKRSADAYGLYAAVTMMLPGAITGMILAVGAQLVRAGALTSGTLVSFLLYQLTLAGSFASLGDIYSSLSSAVGAADKIFTIMDRVPQLSADGVLAPRVAPSAAALASLTDTAGGTAAILPGLVTLRGSRGAPAGAADGAPLFHGRLALEHVTFAYPMRPEVTVLRDFSLSVEPGETVALVGPSGGGKSSIVRLLLRLYDPGSGHITLDGIPLSAYDHAWLHNVVAVVSQEPVLFGTYALWENIVYALDVETEEATGGARAIVKRGPSDVMPRLTHLRPSSTAARAAGGRGVAAARPWWRRLFGWRVHPRRGGGEGGGDGGNAPLLEGEGWDDEFPDVEDEGGDASSTQPTATDLNSFDNTPRIIAAASTRARLAAAYSRVATAAKDGLRLRRRMRAAGLLQEGRGAVEAAAVMATPEQALAALCPRAQWGEASRVPLAGGARGGRKGKSDPSAEHRARVRRLRRVRAWLALQDGASGGDSGLSPSDREVLRIWHGSGGGAINGGEAAVEREGEEGEGDEDAMDPPPPTPTLATMRAIIAAAKAASAHDFISAFPDSYETFVGERGVQLSGGQKQRVACARAFVRCPSVLLLDEATSALDAESEHVVQEALERLMPGRTVIVVAHRLSTVRKCSRICVVEAGSIVEEGTHDGLMARGGAYAALVRRQVEGGVTAK